MSRLDWGRFDGGSFETLMQAILGFVVPDAVAFGRPGRDDGQDAISDCGTHVYQAKYGRTMTMKDAVSRSLEEFEKIKKWKSEENSHWAKVDKWTLVSNFVTNPDDVDIWNNKVVTAFASLNIKADYWDSLELERKLAALPDLERAFWQGENRSLLSHKEMIERLKQGICGKNFFACDYIDSSGMLEQVSEFLKSGDKRILLVTGNAGVGKTRCLFESARKAQSLNNRVFWGLAQTMSSTSSWLSGMPICEIPTCLIIDDVQDYKLVRRLAEQLLAQPLHNYKLIISVQTPFFESCRSVVPSEICAGELVIEKFSNTVAHDFVRIFTENIGLDLEFDLVDSAIRTMGGIPGYLALLLADAKENGKLLVDKPMLDLVLNRVDRVFERYPENIRSCREFVFFWLCALRVLYYKPSLSRGIEEVEFIARMADRTEREVIEDIRKFKEDGLLFESGGVSGRYLAGPSVVRNAVLARHLFEKKSEIEYSPSEEGKGILKKILETKFSASEIIIKNIGEVAGAFLTVTDSAAYFKSFFDVLWEMADSGLLSQQFVVKWWLERIGYIHPEMYLKILKCQHDRTYREEKIASPLWGEMVLTQKQLLSDHPWMLFCLADRIQNEVLAGLMWKMLVAYVGEEAKGEISPAKGQTSLELLSRLLRDVRSCDIYQAPAFDTLTKNVVEKRFGSLENVIAVGLAVPERELVVTSPYSVGFSRKYMLPGTRPWDVSIKIRDMLARCVCNEELPESARNAVWKTWATIRNAWRFESIASRGEQIQSQHRQNFSDQHHNDLKKCAEILEKRIASMTIDERLAARDMWCRQLKHTVDDKEKKLVEKCEGLFKGVQDWPFEEVFRWEGDEIVKRRTEEICVKIASATDVREIENFFNAASEYLKARDPEHPAADCSFGYNLAVQLAEKYNGKGDNSPLGLFVNSALSRDRSQFEDNFLHILVRCWICKFKGVYSDELKPELQRLFGSNENSLRLFVDVYATMPQRVLGQFADVELNFLDEVSPRLMVNQCAALYPGFFMLGCDRIIAAFEVLLKRELDVERQNGLFCSLINNLYLSVLRSEDSAFELKYGEWLLNAMIEYRFDGSYFAAHELQYLVERSGYKLNLALFDKMLKLRFEMEREHYKPYPSFEIMPYEFSVTKFVVDDGNVEAAKSLYQNILFGHTYISCCCLPRYLAGLMSDVDVAKAVVEERLLSKVTLSVGDLQLLGCIAAPYQDTSEQWLSLVKPICEYMFANLVDKSDRYKVYNSFSSMIKTWSSRVGEMPVEFIDRKKVTSEKLQDAKLDSVMQEYWRRADEISDYEIKDRNAEIEEEANV